MGKQGWPRGAISGDTGVLSSPECLGPEQNLLASLKGIVLPPTLHPCPPPSFLLPRSAFNWPGLLGSLPRFCDQSPKSVAVNPETATSKPEFWGHLVVLPPGWEEGTLLLCTQNLPQALEPSTGSHPQRFPTWPHRFSSWN